MPNTMVTSVFKSMLQGLSDPWTTMIVLLAVLNEKVLLCDDNIVGAIALGLL